MPKQLQKRVGTANTLVPPLLSFIYKWLATHHCHYHHHSYSSSSAMAASKLLVMGVFLFIQLVYLLHHVDAAASKVPAIIVFGDSSVDAGNNNHISTIARSNFEPYGQDFPGQRPTGRFCNGRIATDFISEAFGIKAYIPAYLDPAYSIKDFATGVSFGSAATGLDNATSSVLVSNIFRQHSSIL